MALLTVGDIKEMYFEWDIQDFFSLPRKVNTIYFSPDFQFMNATWYLRMDPNYHEVDKSTRWIGLFLVKRKSQFANHVVTCKISMKDRNGEDYKHGTFKWEFVNEMIYGFTMFVKRSQLWKDRRKVAPKGILTVSCTLICKEYAAKTEQQMTIHSKNVSAVPENNTPSMIFWNSFINDEILASDDETDDEDFSIGDEVDNKDISSGDEEDDEDSSDSDEEDFYSDEKEELEDEIEALKTEVQYGNSELEYLKDSVKLDENNDNEVAVLKLKGDKVLQDFKKLLLSEEDSDMTLNVKDRMFRAHRVILKARSPVFRSMFQHNMAEKSCGVVDITDCDPDSFQDFLLYLYSGKVEKMSVSNALGLYSTADKYDVEEIKTECVEFLDKEFSLDTFCDIISLALRHKEQALIESATSFFTTNVDEVILTVQWQTFLKENPVVANELYIKALKKIRA